MLSVKKGIIIIACITIVTVVIFGGKYLISLQKYKRIISGLKIKNVNLSKVSDGKYIGSCDAEVISAEVQVTVKGKKITNIVLLKHKNERGKRAEVIVERVKKAQTLSVDTVSGATNSSKVILKAIENALESGEA